MKQKLVKKIMKNSDLKKRGCIHYSISHIWVGRGINAVFWLFRLTI